jgi:TPR repeat protein
MAQWRIVTAAALALAGCRSGGAHKVDHDHPGLRDHTAAAPAAATTPPAVADAPTARTRSVSEPPSEPTAGHFRRPPDDVIAAVGAFDATLCGELTPDACAKRAARDRDQVAAGNAFAAACAGGSSLGCSNLAGHLSGAIAGSRDPARATALYRYACNAGQLSACHKLIFARASGCLAPRSAPCPIDVTPEEARPVVERACTARDHGACTTLAGYLLAAERDRALALWKDACDAGEPLACHNLADTDPRAATAIALHEKACAADFASSCVKAGLARAVADHRADGRTLVERACALGEPRGCLILDYW